MSGVLAIMGTDISGTGFNPTLRSYTTNGVYTDTIPTGASTIVIELFGESGYGGHGNVTGGSQGGGGGSGGYARSSYTVTAMGGAGKTFTLTLAAGGTASTSTITAGTA